VYPKISRNPGLLGRIMFFYTGSLLALVVLSLVLFGPSVTLLLFIAVEVASGLVLLLLHLQDKHRMPRTEISLHGKLAHYGRRA